MIAARVTILDAAALGRRVASDNAVAQSQRARAIAIVKEAAAGNAGHVAADGGVSWPGLAACLGLPSSEPVTPLACRCPLCGAEAFELHADTILGGYWFSCRHCRRAGDLIELAAAFWQVSLPAAVHQLIMSMAWLPSTEPLEETIRGYVQRYPAYRRRQQDMWQQASHYLRHGGSVTAARLRQQLGLADDIDEDRWRAGPGHLLGALSCRLIEAAFQPHLLLEGSSAGLPANTSAQRVFPGRGWDEALVIPFGDLPLRPCAFLFVGRQGTGVNQVFRRLRMRWREPQPSEAEAGLVGLDLLDKEVSGFVLSLRSTIRSCCSACRFATIAPRSSRCPC